MKIRLFIQKIKTAVTAAGAVTPIMQIVTTKTQQLGQICNKIYQEHKLLIHTIAVIHTAIVIVHYAVNAIAVIILLL